MINWEESVQWLKRQEGQQELVKACFYDDPLIDAARRYNDSSEWKELRLRLPKTKGRVLDIGAGRGISSYAFASDGWSVTALEPDQSDIVGAGAIRQLAAESGMDIGVITEWGERLPFAENTFDVVHMRQALHHARDLREFCKEAGRVLKPGGVFVATREHVISKKEDLAIFLEEHPLHSLYGGENAFLLDEYLSAIGNAGLTSIQVLKPFESDINLYPYSLRDFRMKILKYMEVVYGYIPWIFVFSLKKLFSRPGRIYTFIARKI